MQSGKDLGGFRSFRYEVVLTQMEVNSIQIEVVSWQKWTRRNIPVKVFMFASHMIAIDQNNVIPEREKSCSSGGLGTFSASWIQWISSLKPAWFEGKSDEPHSGTNRPVSPANSKCGNSIMILDCQVSQSFVWNRDFSLYRVDFRWVSNRLRIVAKRLVSKQLCIESTGHRLRWRMNSQAAIIWSLSSQQSVYVASKAKKKCKSWHN